MDVTCDKANVTSGLSNVTGVKAFVTS